MPDDASDDELGDMTRSFNSMAAQLVELRERVRQQDYKEGAADHAAGILHNIRNSISPIGAIAWDLANTENAAWKDQVRRALAEMQGDAVDPDRVRKLQAFVGLSAEKFLAEGDQRRRELENMRGMIRHLDEVLAAEDSVSQIERVREPIEVELAIRLAARLVESRPAARIEVRWPQDIPDVLGSNVNLQQILGNVFINAAEAIEATRRGSGLVNVEIAETMHAGRRALDIAISDDGDGIDAAMLTRIFEKGFSTRREKSGGLGLHWCANTMNGMGGRIRAESEGIGHGATVHLILPLAAPAVADAA
jgi:signal transduction histidine kinase